MDSSQNRPLHFPQYTLAAKISVRNVGVKEQQMLAEWAPEVGLKHVQIQIFSPWVKLHVNLLQDGVVRLLQTG